MIITLANAKGFEIGMDVPADRLCVHEIHRRAGHGDGFPQRDEALACGEELRSVELQHMVQY